MGTPLTHVVVVKPFFRDTTLVPSNTSIRNFFLHTGEQRLQSATATAWSAVTKSYVQLTQMSQYIPVYDLAFMQMHGKERACESSHLVLPKSVKGLTGSF